MVDEIILHIGMNKTGSTSIQKYLHNYEDENSIFANLTHPKITQYFNHSKVFTQLFAKNKHPNIPRKECENLVLSQISRNPKKLIFSAETISLFDDEEKMNLENFMTQFTRKLKIFAYVRSPLDFAKSAFQERVKTGLNYIPNTMSPNYSKRFEYWRVSKAVDLEIIDYDKNLSNNDVVEDFCNRFNLVFSKNTSERLNESLSFASLILLYHFNQTAAREKLQQLKNFDECKRRLNWNIKKIYRTSKPIDKSYFRFLADYSETEYLEKHFNISFAEDQRNHSYGEEELEEQLNNFDEVNYNKLRLYLSKSNINLENVNDYELVQQLFEYLLNKLN